MNPFDPRHVEIHGVSNPKLEGSLAWILVILLIAIFVVLFATQVSVVATTDSRITTSSKSRPIQSIYGGRIVHSPLKSLQTVKAGNILYKMDTANVTADIANQSISKNELQISNSRIHTLKSIFMEIQANPLTAPLPETPNSATENIDPVALSIYAALRDKVIALRKRFEATAHENDNYAAQHRYLSAAAQSLQDRTDKMRGMVSSGFMPKAGLMVEEEKLLRVKSELSDLAYKQNIAVSSQQEITSNIRAVINEILSSQSQNFTSNLFKLDSINQTLLKLQHSLKQETLTAPVDGMLQVVRFAGEGAVVAPGEIIAWVVPNNDRLEFEVQIKNTDIGFIHPGQKVVIKIDTYPFEKYGTLPGKVVRVGTDSVFDEATGWTYRAIVQSDHDFIVIDGIKQRLRIGETGKADIILRKRRLIDYFMEPVFKYTSETFETK